MSLNRFNARRDANHREIEQALKAYGWRVRNIKHPADFLIVKNGRMLLADAKRDAKAKVTKSQQAAIDDGFPLVFLRSVEDVQALTSAGDGRPTRR